MNDESPLDPRLARALSELRQPPARAEFKSELRARFVDVEGGDAALNAQVVTPPAERRRFGWWLAGLAAAAVIVLMFRALSSDVAPRWRVLEAGGALMVDGIEFASADVEGITRALESARELRTNEGRVRLAYEDLIVLELDARSHVTQLRFTPAGDYALCAERGSVRTATAPKFKGTKLRVFTPDLELDVVGTAFALDVGDEGTCLCCQQGRVQATPRGESRKLVEAGHMTFAYRTRAESASGAAYEPHVRPLRALEQWVVENWR